MRCFALSVSAALAASGSGDHGQLWSWLKSEPSGDNVDALLNNAGSSNSAESAIEAAVLNAGASDAEPAEKAEEKAPEEAPAEEKPAEEPMADEKDEDADASLASTGSQHESSEQDA